VNLLQIGVELVALQPELSSLAVLVHSTHAPLLKQYELIRPGQVLLSKSNLVHPTHIRFIQTGVIPEQSDETTHLLTVLTHAPVGTHFNEFSHGFCLEQVEQTPLRVQIGRVVSLQSKLVRHSTQAPSSPHNDALESKH